MKRHGNSSGTSAIVTYRVTWPLHRPVKIQSYFYTEEETEFLIFFLQVNKLKNRSNIISSKPTNYCFSVSPDWNSTFAKSETLHFYFEKKKKWKHVKEILSVLNTAIGFNQKNERIDTEKQILAWLAAVSPLVLRCSSVLAGVECDSERSVWTH